MIFRRIPYGRRVRVKFPYFCAKTHLKREINIKKTKKYHHQDIVIEKKKRERKQDIVSLKGMKFKISEEHAGELREGEK